MATKSVQEFGRRWWRNSPVGIEKNVSVRIIASLTKLKTRDLSNRNQEC
jgi:hypothetical protein